MPAFVLEALETVLLTLETVKLPFCFVGAVVAEASRSMYLKIVHQLYFKFFSKQKVSVFLLKKLGKMMKILNALHWK